MAKNQNAREVKFDQGIAIARTVALVMLVILHAAAINFYQFSDKWWATNFYDSLTRSCVPIFLMISGALLLRKNEQLSVFFRKRVFRIIPALLFWSLVYLTLRKAAGNGIEYWKWIPSILDGPVAIHLWYLYTIIGLYAFVPLFRKVYSGTTESEKRFYIAMWFFVASIFPTLRNYFQFSWDVVAIFNLGAFAGLIGYFFLGAYVFDSKKTSNCNWIKWLIVFMASSIATMLMTYTHSLSVGSPNELFYGYLSPFIVIASFAAFKLCIQHKIVLSDRQQKVLSLINEYSLGIYCVHFMTLGILKRAGLSGLVGSAWWSIPVSGVTALVVSFLIIGMLRRFPLMRHVT